MNNRKVYCTYNKFFFENIYQYMLKNQVQTAVDASETMWHLLDVEDILIKEYGYRRASNGGLL